MDEEKRMELMYYDGGHYLEDHVETSCGSKEGTITNMKSKPVKLEVYANCCVKKTPLM